MNRKGEIAMGYLITGIIVIIIMVALLIIFLGPFPDIQKNIGSVADDVLKIKKEVFGEAKLEKESGEMEQLVNNLVKGLEECYLGEEIGCVCPFTVSRLPKDYKLWILHESSGGQNNLLMRAVNPADSLIKGMKSKLFSGVTLGVAELGYIERQSLTGSGYREFVDIVCRSGVKGSPEYHIVGGDNAELMFPTPEWKTESSWLQKSVSYDNLLVSDGILPLYKYGKGEFCFLTDRFDEERYETEFGKDPAYFDFKSGETLHSLMDLVSETSASQDYDSIARQRLKSAPRCGDINYHEYVWPVDDRIVNVECGDVNRNSMLLNTHKYDYIELVMPKGTYIKSVADSTVSEVCDAACNPGRKYLVMKHTDRKTGYALEIRYDNLENIVDKFKSIGARAKRGEAIAHVGDPGDGAALGISMKVAGSGDYIDPACRLPTLALSHYDLIGSCDAYSYEILLGCR